MVVVSGYAKIDSPRIDFHKFIADRGVPEPEGFLEKPIDPERILETVAAVLAEKKIVKN